MNSHLDRSWRVGAMFAAGLTSLALSSASSGQPLQCEFEQVTHTTEGFSATPSIDASGTRIAFSSRRNVTPGPATVHVYLIDTAAATETQVSLVSRSFRPSISGDGNRIGFGLPTPSPIGGQWDVYLYDKPSSTTQQLTGTPNAANANDQHQLNGDGTRVVLRSSADLTGDSLPIWGTQLFLWDEASGFSQLTDVGGVGVNDIAIDGSGTLLAFSSHADLDPPADNSEGSREVFLYHTATGTFTQVTDTPAGTLSQYIDLSADGSHLAFVSTADLLAGQNADHSREVFLYDVAAKSFRQITDDPEINSGPRLNADGSKLVFYTEYADHYRMFVYDAATNAVNAVTPASA
jgi:Tol biopolymer transport system component